jgi:hypothetical protein
MRREVEDLVVGFRRIARLGDMSREGMIHCRAEFLLSDAEQASSQKTDINLE